MARRASEKTQALELLLLDATSVGRVLGFSRSHVFELHSRGRLPLPIRPGGPNSVPRWRADELRAWVSAGCPSREQWEQQRSAAR